MVKNLFKKAFNIRDGEMKIALLMQLYIFLVITVLLLIKPTVTAVFLSDLGSDSLPYGYLLVALVAVLSSYLYNWLNNRFSIKFIAISTVILFAVVFLSLSYFIQNDSLQPWLLYFYYVSISLFGVLVTSQFWVIANIVFDLREAKRLFGFIGAGAIAGGIFGGYLTTILANSFGNSIVILIATILLLSSLPIVFSIWKIRVNRLNKFIREERVSKKKSLLESSFGMVIKSKHLINLASIVGVSVIVAKLIDYQFSDISHKAYPDSDELASFFGFWFSTFNIVSLLIQLFLTNKLLARYGVSRNLLLLPLGLFLGSALFFIFPELWVLILIKGVDGSFKQSINKASFELSMLPVSYETKKQAKPFIDVVVDSVATGIAGFLLIFIIKGLHVSTNYITMIILFFLLVWFFLIYRLRDSYFEAFRKNIRELVSGNKESKKTRRKQSSDALLEVFQSGTDNEIITLLKHLNESKIDHFKPYIVKLLDHTSDRVKAEAIRELYHYDDPTIFQKISLILDNNSEDEVVYESMEYILAHSARQPKKVVIAYLDHKKDYIKNAALLCLARSSRYNEPLGKKYDLNRRIEEQIKEFTNLEEIQRKEELAALLLTIGYSGKKKYYSFINKYLNSTDPLLVSYAIKASGFTRYEPFIRKLIELLGVHAYREEGLIALRRYGDSIVNKLFAIDEEEVLDDRIRMNIPFVLEAFQNRKSMVLLLRLLKSNSVSIRIEAARVLERISKKDYKLKISSERLDDNMFDECLYFKSTLSAINTEEYLVRKQNNNPKKNAPISEEQTVRKDLLEYLLKQLDISLKTIFTLLSIKYSEADMEVAFLGITNETEESRINTIEFLSNLLESNLKDELLPLLEYHFLTERETDLKIEKISEEDVLLNILKEGDIETKLKGLNLIQYLNNSNFSEIIKELTKDKNPKISTLAKKIVKN